MKVEFYYMHEDTGDADTYAFDVESAATLFSMIEEYQNKLGTNAVDVYVGEHFEFPMVIFRKEIEPF